MDKKLKFNDLIVKYNETIASINVEDLKDKNRVCNIDIERMDKDIEDLDKRIGELQSQLDGLNSLENSYEYPEQILEKETAIKEVEDFKNTKIEKQSKLKETIEKNNKDIEIVANIYDTVIQEAEDRTEEANNAIQEKIEKLQSQKIKFGLDMNRKKTIYS